MKKFKVRLKTSERKFKVKIIKKEVIYAEESLPDLLLIYNLSKV